MFDNYKLKLLVQIENLLGESIEYIESDIKRVRENFITKSKDILNKYRGY